MIFARARRWPAALVPLLVFSAVLIHGSTFGLTDDEAYYWVLAQRPALGYAFHPPAIGWSVALSQALVGWLWGHYSIAMVRLPAAVSAGLLVSLGVRWLRLAGGTRLHYGAWVIVAFAGLFSLNWMIVPDTPLFVGWTIAFVATWELCFGEHARPAKYLMLAGGIALATLSKYSAVLGAISSLAAIWQWAPRERRLRATAALAIGGLLAALPILWWNAHHEWASILYQIRERHGASQLSGIRYLRFWAVETVLMGPPLLVYLFRLLKSLWRRTAGRPEHFALLWALPGAAVFCVQPLWADFKPHWALIVWWPLALALAWRASRSELPKLVRAQLIYGVTLIVLVWTACHLPLQSWATAWIKSGAPDPKLDVTNDLYGWADLRENVRVAFGDEALRIPFVGSRYQTAAQAAFAMGEGARVTMLPRDLKAMDEWPDIGVSDGQGPAWPALRQTIFFVADGRYEGRPDYRDADCAQVRTFETRRYGYIAKTIYLWKCVPRSSRP